MKIIRKPIANSDLKKMASKMFGNLVKAVVDIEKEIIALDGELHADEEKLLIDDGSRQEDVWGINLYPDYMGLEEFIEFDSLINLRPSVGNNTRSVDNPETRKKIIKIVRRLIIK